MPCGRSGGTSDSFLFCCQVLLESERCAVSKYSPLPFSPCASTTEANRSPQNPAGKLADCREVFILEREVFARVDFDFSFLGYLAEEVLVCEFSVLFFCGAVLFFGFFFSVCPYYGSKPFPAESRWEVGGLPRGFFIEITPSVVFNW